MLERSNGEESEGLDMKHAWVTEKCAQHFKWNTWTYWLISESIA